MKTILVVFGGQSVEHDVSIITGQVVSAALKAAQFTPVPLYIARDGSIYSSPELGDIETFRDPDFSQKLAKMKPVLLSFDGGLKLVSTGLRSREQVINAVFPAMHGTYGEDGTIQGLARLSNLPFIGCDLEASAIAMDKVLTKQVTEQAGILTVPYVWFNAEDWQKSPDTVRQQLEGLKTPLFVKPAHLGSSIGITRVSDRAELDNAIEVALHYDDKVIVEQGVKNPVEVNCAVMGHREIETSVLEQPLHKAEFLNFEDKYIRKGAKSSGSMSGDKSSVKIPAEVPEEVAIKVKEMAVTAFEAIGGSGIARLDFLVDPETDDVYLNEINPLPGSLQQHLWKASGISNADLVKRLVEAAEARFAERQKLTSTFASSVLNQAGGAKQA